MDFKHNLNEKELLEYEEFHKTAVRVFQTQFKGGKYISSMVDGFSAFKFVGTGEEYSVATACFYADESLGKIIGTMSWTIEEWNELHKPKEEAPKTSRTYLQIVKENRSEEYYQKELAKERAAVKKYYQRKRRNR